MYTLSVFGEVMVHLCILYQSVEMLWPIFVYFIYVKESYGPSMYTLSLFREVTSHLCIHTLSMLRSYIGSSMYTLSTT